MSDLEERNKRKMLTFHRQEEVTEHLGRLSRAKSPRSRAEHRGGAAGEGGAPLGGGADLAPCTRASGVGRRLLSRASPVWTQLTPSPVTSSHTRPSLYCLGAAMDKALVHLALSPWASEVATGNRTVSCTQNWVQLSTLKGSSGWVVLLFSPGSMP